MKRAMIIAAALALLPSWAGLFGNWHWLLDLLAHFRWQYLLASVIVVAWGWWRGHRGITVLAVATLLLNAALIGRVAWQAQSGLRRAQDGRALHVLSLNVRTSNPDSAAVLDLLAASDADVVFLMEVDQRWMAALAALHARYPHHIAHPRSDNFGVALFSRMPWRRADVRWLGDATVPAIEAEMTHQGRDFVLLGVHPLPPISRRHAASRDLQLQALADHAALRQEPVLVVGDLNATPWSTGLRIATAGRLGLRSRSAPWVPTWRARSIFALPIDHALATAPLVITDRSVGADVGSDHRPIRITVGWEIPAS